MVDTGLGKVSKHQAREVEDHPPIFLRFLPVVHTPSELVINTSPHHTQNGPTGNRHRRGLPGPEAYPKPSRYLRGNSLAVDGESVAAALLHLPVLPVQPGAGVSRGSRCGSGRDPGEPCVGGSGRDTHLPNSAWIFPETEKVYSVVDTGMCKVQT